MRAALCAALLAGCGTDPKVIDLAIPGTQVLVTEKVNGGAWTKLAGQFDGDANATTYSIEIGDEYELAVVCLRSGPTDAGQFVAAEVFGTGEDAEVTLASWKTPNCLVTWSGSPDAHTPLINTTGTFDEAMDVAVGTSMFRTYPGEEFFLHTNAGMRDVVAYSNTKLVIQHDVQLDEGTVLAPIHVAQDGGSVAIAPVVATLDPVEEVYLTSTLITRNSTYFTWRPSDPGSAMFAPAELLGSGDTMRFVVEMAGDNAGRLLQCSDPDDLEDPAALSRLAPFTRHGDGVGATWTSIPEFFTSATIATTSSNYVPSTQRVTASKSWLERHGKGMLDFDLDVDGYDPAWTVTAATALDGANTGKSTPTKLTVPAGHHSIRLIAAAQHVNKQVGVDVTAKKTTRINESF